MIVLLDTCTLIWLCSEPDKLSVKAIKIIDNPDTALLVSHVSAWEMSLKSKTGKMIFPKPLRRWLAEQKDVWHFEWLPISLEHILSTNELPDHHKDPFDRLIVSQAMKKNIPVVTPDDFIKKYAVEIIW